MRSAGQPKLFDTASTLPSGFVYRPDFLTQAEEAEIVGYLEDLPLERSLGSAGYYAKRRVMNFGWGYDFKKGRIVPGDPLPPWLMPVARKAAKWIDISPSRVVEALISEYEPGAAIGWHRDNEGFEHVIGVSLSGWCRLRLRPLRRFERHLPKEVTSIELEPRSAYLLQDDSRWQYQHSIPPTRGLRYSITFRTLPGK
jgi:alkylated DNA repair dioxygenase AlkB